LGELTAKAQIVLKKKAQPADSKGLLQSSTQTVDNFVGKRRREPRKALSCLISRLLARILGTRGVSIKSIT
jgi:hypothetical protein